MTDYVAVMLTGFSTGCGVIAANEVYDVFKRHGIRKFAKGLISNERNLLLESLKNNKRL